jgi:hypothetical protein
MTLDYPRVMPVRQSHRIVAVLLLTWLGLAAAVGVSGQFQRASAPVVALTVWTLTALVLLTCWKVASIRSWALNVPPRRLVLFHLTRLVGFYFLFLERRGEMPPAFAVPAGWGDVTVAVLAVVVLVSSDARNWSFLLIWNCVGLVDILFVVVAALRIGLQDWQSMHALRAWPLNLLPTFVVPLIIASHVLIFVRFAARKKSRAD